MKNLKMKIIFMMLSCTYLITGCSEINMGVPIPADKQAIKLSLVQKKQKEYKDKQILIAGNYGGRCGGCCNDFVLKEGINYIKVDINGLKLPDMNMGLPMKVYGTLKTTKQNPYIQALGVETIE